VNVSNRLIMIVSCIPENRAVTGPELAIGSRDFLWFFHWLKHSSASLVIAGVRMYHEIKT
jgi:hypothetical protein